MEYTYILTAFLAGIISSILVYFLRIRLLNQDDNSALANEAPSAESIENAELKERMTELIEEDKFNKRQIEKLRSEISRKDILLEEKQVKKDVMNPKGFNPETNEVDDNPTEDEEEIFKDDLEEVHVKMDGGSDDDDNNYRVETILFGTNRSHTENNSKLKFGNDNNKLKLGKCEVSIPRDHELGKIERPFLGIKFLENADKHIVVQGVNLMNENDFVNLLCSQISEDEEHKAFLFIHGYNSSFEAAARRTAQMKVDLKFDGAAMFYSWPSEGKEGKYLKDGEMTRLSERHLEKFILNVLNCSEVESLYVIGHSMGNRPLCNVMKDIIGMDEKYRKIIKEIILTAPDVNAEIFVQDIVPEFQKYKKVITLYASSTDLALQSSNALNGFRRAGESGKNIIIQEGVETIDAMDVDASLTDITKHSYFSKNVSVLNDIADLIKNKNRPSDRFYLEDVKDEDGVYWKFKK